MRKIFMSWLTAPVADPFEGLMIARDAGYAGLGMRLCDPMTGEAASALVRDAQLRRPFASALKAADMAVEEVEARILARGTGRQVAPEVFETAASLGSPLFIAAADQAGTITLPELCDRFGALADEAAEFGLTVGFEPIAHRACGTLAEAQRVISGVKGAVLVLDALHLHRMGITADELARIDPELLRVFHICDAPPTPEDLIGQIDHSAFNRLVPGEGILPLADYLVALPAAVPISLEVPMNRLDGIVPPVERAARCITATRQLLNLGTLKGPH